MSNKRIKKLRDYQVLDLLAKFPRASKWYNIIEDEANLRFKPPIIKKPADVVIPKKSYKKPEPAKQKVSPDWLREEDLNKPLPKIKPGNDESGLTDILKGVTVPKVPPLPFEPKPGCPRPIVMMRPNPVPNWKYLSVRVKDAIVAKLKAQHITIDYQTGKQII